MQSYEIVNAKGKRTTIQSDTEPTLAQIQAALASLDKEDVSDRQQFMAAESALAPEWSSLASPSVREDVKTALPSLAAMGLTAMVPGAGVPAALGRLAVAGGGAYVASRATGATPEEATQRAAIESAAQGAGDVAAMAGRQMYRSVIGLTNRLRQQHPRALEQLMAGRGILKGTPVTENAARSIESSIDDAKKAVDDVIASTASKPNAPRVDPADVVQRGRANLQAYIDQLRAVDSKAAARLEKVADRRYGDLVSSTGDFANGSPADLQRVQTSKRLLQKRADEAYAAMRRGTSKVQLSPDDLVDIQMAHDMRMALEKTVPEVAPLNAKMADEIGQLRVLNDALQRTSKHVPFGGLSDLAAMNVFNISGSGAAALAGKAASFGPTKQYVARGMMTAPEIVQTGRGSMFPVLQIGKVVTLPDGSRVMVTSVSDDGQAEGVPVKQ